MDTNEYASFELACGNDRDKVFALLGDRKIQHRIKNILQKEQPPLEDKVLEWLRKKYIDKLVTYQNKQDLDESINEWVKLIHFMSESVRVVNKKPSRIPTPFVSVNNDDLTRHFQLFYGLLHAIHADHKYKKGEAFKECLIPVNAPCKPDPRKAVPKVPVSATPSHPMNSLDAAIRTMRTFVDNNAKRREESYAMRLIVAEAKKLRAKIDANEN